ncbi:MAG: tetratricopeptide repeat protein [Myxococcales bacterium]|nr:tetratricopeptide repeat protein [Myxococcales bacterium]MCB9642501.1 tetratricopeptide repeat protein [Myxococcales bacterium]
MAWLPFQAFSQTLAAPQTSEYLQLHVDQLRPVILDGWALLVVQEDAEEQVEAWFSQEGSAFKSFLRLLSGQELSEEEFDPERLYISLEMQRKRMYVSYLSLLEALAQLAPWLEDAAIFLKEDRAAVVDFLQFSQGELLCSRHPCASSCEDDLLRTYDGIAAQYPEEESLCDFVSLRRLRVAADFIDQLFEKHSEGLPLNGPLTPQLEINLKIVAENLQTAAKHTPDAIDVWHQFARFSIWFADPETVELAFQAVYQLDPSDPWAHFDHAVYLWQQGRLQDAMEHHQHFLAAEPHDPLGLLFAGFLYTKEEMHEAAKATWQDLDSQAEELLSDLSRWKDLQRPEYAAELLALWLQHAHSFLTPQTHAQAYLRAALLLQTWQPWESLPAIHRQLLMGWLEQARLLAPSHPEVGLQSARILRKQGQHQQAYQTLLQTHQQNPQHTEVLFLLGRVCAEREQYSEAVRHFRLLLALCKGQDDYTLDLYKAQLAAVLESEAQRLWLEEDYIAAEAHYDQILEVYAETFVPPGMETPWLQKARLRLKEEKTGLALACTKKALEINPASAQANALSAYTLAHMNRFPEAMPHIQRALSQAPHDPFALYTQACIFAMTGRRKDALPLLERALLANPSLRHDASNETLLQRLHALSPFWELLNEPTQPSS